MTTVAAVSACLVLAALAVFQIVLVGGAPLGRFAWGGRHEVLPPRLRVGSVVSIITYGFIALVILRRAGLVDVGSEGFATVALWVVVAYFFLGIGLNLASRSRPERVLMTPVAALLCALCAVVAAS